MLSFAYQRALIAWRAHLLVRQAHVRLVRLHVVGRDRLELGRRDRLDEPARVNIGQTAATHSLSTGSSSSISAQAMKRLRSVLLIEPIGLMSADEQSYLVR